MAITSDPSRRYATDRLRRSNEGLGSPKVAMLAQHDIDLCASGALIRQDTMSNERRMIVPVLAMQMASHATERRFYGQLLTTIGVPFAPRATVLDWRSRSSAT
jgi:Bacterial TniB protein